MNIFGCIIFLIIGILIILFVPKLLNHKNEDYSKYPVTTGKVCHQHDFIGNRWIVSFLDENGKEVLRMDNIISSYNTFSPEKYTIPKVGTEEKIYFWKNDHKSQFSINNQKVEYYIHFCNEKLYSLQITKGKRHSTVAIIIGLTFIIFGIFIGLFG